MSPLRVLVVTDRISGRGGADRHLWDVVDALKRRGDHVRVATGRVDPGAAPQLPGAAPPIRSRALASAVASHRQLDRLRPHMDRADVLLVQNVMNPTALRLLSETGRAVALVQDHRVFCPGPGRTLPNGERCDRQPTAAACAECLPDADYRARALALTQARRDALAGAEVVVLSQYMQQEMGEGAVIPPWIFVDSAPPEGPRDRIVLAGRMVSHKAVADAHRAWQMAGEPLPLHVAGEGPDADAMTGAHHHGWLPRPELWALLRRARVVLFPARWQEPFGILGVEALACGAPVVVADVGGVRDWAQGGATRVAAGDVPGMADALRGLCEGPAEAEPIAKARENAIRERYAINALLPLWDAVLARAASGQPRVSDHAVSDHAVSDEPVGPG